ncbi:maleylpyruvate isomerase family mycothiol-dependent enzyme [Actinoplanes utahensis]|uniref:Mycothiol-dependent maleylpyruvate isomerase metal-binding domain-containing protein n=1 Tax=Actinoplanes utahensis TaxID=1869 RepID=A0A0A6UPP2_ACTUT|nr:maleylpyruvate isomerase family mycothiol-dependent enzyme [Actinoplanes utahensis]KHD78115.1 hypothetical protein MB27_06430 [Actinoplanes utahensis]GIF30581.1 hypothetical protein Aut01nite_35670 [Actinoplanes utahensis]
MTDTDSHETVVPLIGAWALDACSPAEDAFVEAHLAACPSCARLARRLREAAAGIVDTRLRPPPGGLDRLRATVHRSRRPVTPTAPFAAPYAAQVAALDLLLSQLTGEEWSRVAAYGELTVHDLVAHLGATDGLVSAGIGLPVDPPAVPGQRLAARTAAVLRVERARSPEETRRAWRAQADELCRALVGQSSPGTATVLMGRPFPLVDAVLARAFETWIHTEDIAAATGRPIVVPLPEHIHPMTDFAVRVLPAVISRHIAPPHDRLIRLHLTGPGGGIWTVPLDLAAVVPATARPAAEVTVDLVEFCRMAADRQDPARVTARFAGDTALARDFLNALPSMATVP